MDVSDYRILQVIYLTLENTKLERQQMSPFQFRRLIIEALQSRTYTVNVMSSHQRMFVVDSLVILFFPYDLENDVSVQSFLLSSLQSGKIEENIKIAYSVRNGIGACVLRIECPEK
ncbi:MAG: hypothetical protein IJI41_08805 [Anaerolineaceae bacterium]|nr:hypothetical protein [Anaerolineaceae bacterium]